MKIKALLIGAEGSGDSYLPGVKQDINSFKNYLMSEDGGAWKDNEISILNSPSKLLLSLSLINITAENNDFILIYFAGHGSFSQLEGRKFYLNDKDYFTLNDVKNTCKKLLFIGDNCAKKEPLVISEKYEASVEDRQFDNMRVMAREKYLKWLGSCDNQKIYLFGCKEDEYSGETDEGGHFTQALINESKKTYKDLSVLEAFTLAKIKVQNRTEYEQNPTYTMNTRPLKVLPFKIS